MEIKPFDFRKFRDGAKVCTRDGHDVRVLDLYARCDCYDAICGLVTIDNYEHPHLWTHGGMHVEGSSIGFSSPNELDLCLKVEHKEGWVNLYKREWGIETSDVYVSEEQAVKGANASVIATVKIEWEE